MIAARRALARITAPQARADFRRMPIETFLLELVIILLAAKIGGEIAERLRQPAVLGELIAGIVVGVSVFGHLSAVPGFGPLAQLAVDPNSELLRTLGEVGAILLLFEAGLDSDLEDLKRLGFAALWVAFIGVAFPLILGFVVAHYVLHWSVPTAVFLGAALTATSVGITARTFADLKMSERTESKIVLGAAVADDVLGLIVLAVVSGLYATSGGAAGGEEHRSIFAVVFYALAFLVGSLFIGFYAAPFVLRYAARMRTRAALATAAVTFCFFVAAMAHIIGGLAPIVGAFAAGLILARTEHKLHFEQRIKPIADIFIPIFFVLMGAAMPVSAINPLTPEGRTTLILAGSLLIVAVITKIAAGLTLPMRGVSRWLIGVGMIPRGEVGLIFASVGMAKGLVDQEIFTALVLTIMGTTFVTPPILKIVSQRLKNAPTEPPAERAVMPPAAEATGV